MEKLSIQQASTQFGISRARLYKLLNKGTLVGHLSAKKDGKSWIHPESLQTYLDTREEKGGRPKIRVESDGRYLPVREAAKKTGYTTARIYQLMKLGSMASRKGERGLLVYFPDLLNYKRGGES